MVFRVYMGSENDMGRGEVGEFIHGRDFISSLDGVVDTCFLWVTS